MATDSIKRKILEVVVRLPEGASVEDAMEHLYFLTKVERGLAQADANDIISHDDAKNRVTR